MISFYLCIYLSTALYIYDIYILTWPRRAQMLDGGKRFGIKSTVGYRGHQPQWRTEEWDHIQVSIYMS